MKRYILGIILFFVSVAIVDVCIGTICDYLNAHVKGGDARSHYEAYREVAADIIILGSSRADHHYDPAMLEDSLGMSCCNCGYDALGILSMYPRLKSILKRHTPRLVVYDVMPANEIYGSEADHLKFLGDAKRYCDDPDIMDFIASVAPDERYKLRSRLYRYNTSIFQLLRDFLQNSDRIDRGYRPLHETMDYTPPPFKVEFADAVPDTTKLRCVEQMILDSRKYGFLLVFTASPWYHANSLADFEEIIRLCQQYDIPFISHYTDDDMVNSMEYFQDSSHLNATGAHLYTRKLIPQLRALLASPHAQKSL